MDQNNVQNIIFDLGNVIINVDSELTVKAMKSLGFNNFQESYTLFKQTDLFDRLEKGEISPKQLRSELRKHMENQVSDEEFDRAWGAMLLDFPGERIDLIKKLGNKYNLYLLSNTNEIHYQQYMKDFKEVYGFDFNSLFIKAYYSHQVGFRKPDIRIYEHIIKDSTLIPRESVFIDDLKINIEAAQKAGLQTLWLDIENGEDITHVLHGF